MKKVIISLAFFHTSFFQIASLSAWEVSSGRDATTSRPYASLIQKADGSDVFLSLECQIGSLQFGIALPEFDANEIKKGSLSIALSSENSQKQYINLSVGSTSSGKLILTAERDADAPKNVIRYMLFNNKALQLHLGDKLFAKFSYGNQFIALASWLNACEKIDPENKQLTQAKATPDDLRFGAAKAEACLALSRRHNLSEDKYIKYAECIIDREEAYNEMYKDENFGSFGYFIMSYHILKTNFELPTQIKKYGSYGKSLWKAVSVRRDLSIAELKLKGFTENNICKLLKIPDC